MRSAGARARFEAAHEATRRILGQLVGAPPERLRFATTELGKPLLSDWPDVDFSLSHSDGIAGLAVSLRGPVGFDCETVGRIPDDELPWTQLCSEDELRLMARCDPAERAAWFYRIWTCKEAVLKGAGLGLNRRLGSLSVLPAGAEPGAMVEVEGSGPWWVSPVEAPAGVVAALSSRTARQVESRRYGLAQEGKARFHHSASTRT